MNLIKWNLDIHAICRHVLPAIKSEKEAVEIQNNLSIAQ
jgi:hypothetical protein